MNISEHPHLAVASVEAATTEYFAKVALDH